MQNELFIQDKCKIIKERTLIMKKRLIATMLVACLAVTSMIGCGSSKSEETTTTNVEVPAEPFGDAIKYDPTVEINEGKDITVELWEWGSDELFQKAIDGYTAIHPNVKIKLVNNPWEDYWTKLPLALDGANGPAIFNVHNSQHENLINYMAPLEIPLEDIMQANIDKLKKRYPEGFETKRSLVRLQGDL